MKLVAHRGFAGEHPENTLSALRAASRVADAVEVDVRRCGSGELVVCHDETVDRTTDGSGPVRAHSLADLRALDVLGTGEGVPTLAEAVGALPPDTGVVAELKEPGTAADAVAVLDGFEGEAVVSSFHPEALARARRADPSVARAVLLADDPDRGLSLAADLDAGALHAHLSLCLETDLPARARDAGRRLDAWTVTTRAETAALRAAGVDGVIADRTDVLDRTGGSSRLRK